MLEEHKDKWEFIAEYLIRYEEMDSDQFSRAMKEDVSAEEIYAMAEERRERSRRENEEKARIDEEERKKREEELMKNEDYRQGAIDVNDPQDGEPQDGEPHDEDGEKNGDGPDGEGQ